MQSWRFRGEDAYSLLSSKGEEYVLRSDAEATVAEARKQGAKEERERIQADYDFARHKFEGDAAFNIAICSYKEPSIPVLSFPDTINRYPFSESFHMIADAFNALRDAVLKGVME